MIDLPYPDGMTLDEADALCRRVRADYPRQTVYITQADAFSPFVVMAYLPSGIAFRSETDYERYQEGRYA